MTDRASCYDVPGFHQELYKEHRTKNTERIESTGEKKASGYDAFMKEVYHRCYSTVPSKVEKPATSAAMRSRMHDLLTELPEFETLRKQTMRDPLWSGMATSALSESVAKALPERVNTPDADSANKLLEGFKHLVEAGIPVPEDMLARAQGQARGEEFRTAEQADALNDTELRQALREGIQSAGEKIADAESAMSALGYGTGEGSNSFRSANIAVELAKRVAGSKHLKDIIEIAGRLTATARAKRSSRTEYARSEIVGVEPTRQLTRILPSEMLNLASPLGTANLYKKLMENAALGYNIQGKEKVAKGPVIICIDQSGSMGGNPDVWAKGIALAMLDAARSEKRPFGIVLYDSRVVGTLLCPVLRRRHRLLPSAAPGPGMDQGRQPHQSVQEGRHRAHHGRRGGLTRVLYVQEPVQGAGHLCLRHRHWPRGAVSQELVRYRDRNRRRVS